MIIASYNKETGEWTDYKKPEPGVRVIRLEEKPAEPAEPIVFRVEEKPAEPVEKEAKGLPKETIKDLLRQAQANLDGGFVWQYVNQNTNVNDLLQTIEGDPLVTVSIAAFFAGMKYTLENLDAHE